MTELRKAAEMALEALENVYGKGKRCEAAIKELRQALAESANSTTDFVESKAADQPEQEPVAWITDGGKGDLGWRKTTEKDMPLYTAPPKKGWVGLSGEEIESELTKEFGQWWSRHVSVCRAIEAKLKEKNGG